MSDEWRGRGRGWRSPYYRLEGRIPVAEPDVLAWGRWFETASQQNAQGRRVALTEMIGPLHVSTVFIGIDMNHSETGPPLLFESMVFGDAEGRGEMIRTATWDQAEAAHAVLVELCRARLSAAEPLLRPRPEEQEP